MGNQKSLYKTYFNEVYLKRSEENRGSRQTRPQTGIDNQLSSTFQTHSSSGGSSRQTPDSLMGGAASQHSHQPYYTNGVATGRATADLVTSTSRFSGYHTQRNQKTFKVIIDNNYTLVINIPEKLPPQNEDDNNCGIASEIPTCGWLLEQVEKKYAQLIKGLKSNGQSNTKFRKKLIVALKTVDKNENIDFWLTQYSRTLKALPNGLVLEPHYTKIIMNKPKAVCIDDFERLKVIGKGGFSKVYMVRKKDTGFIYAMKVMKKDKVTNESKFKQIMNERTIMEQLSDHPFVIKLHYAFQSKEHLHFIIDFCTGGEMFYHLQQNAKFPEFLAKFYFAEILLGIEYLHQKNIVYRDLKPENVLIDVDGHVKVADFGLSKIFKRDERSFSFCGSPEYMCPEILKREGHNHMVDYYTLGAILYEMLTGFPPYYTNNKTEMTMRILESELTFPSNLNPQVISLMKSLLQRNPAKRLGHHTGVEEIKSHEWCQDIDWNLFMQKKISPPWKPRLDSSNFDPEYTQLPLNFDENNFKRALQGDREFSFYYESPCQSLTVTEHSIYASNPDLTNSTNAELLLQSGSSKVLLEHFFNQQPMAFTRMERQPSVLSPRELAEIFSQQKILLQMNTEMALKINNELIRDESRFCLEYNQESGLTNFRGFSFYGESDDEREVKRQLIKYTKLRNKLNKRLKQIQDEEGVIRERKLKDIYLSTPSSSLSSAMGTTILPTPPVLEDASSRNSLPSQRVVAESFNTSSYSNKIIDKKSKQQMIMTRLGSDAKTDRGGMYKSFQPEPKANKKYELFRSNIEHTDRLLLAGGQQSLSHKEYLNESIKDLSSNDESVAEERESQDENTTVRWANNGPHQIMGSGLDFYHVSRLEESKERANTTMEQLEESKESITPVELNQDNLNNVKFILFQSQQVSKNKDKKIPKLVVTQRSRMANKKDSSSMSGSGNTTKLRFQLATTTGGGTSLQQNSSSSQAATMAHQMTGDTMEVQKSVIEKTPEYSTKNTYEKDNSLYAKDISDELDKTANIITLQQQEKSQIKKLRLSPRKVKEQSSIKKIFPQSGFKKKNLEIEIQSPEPTSKLHSKKVSIAEPNDIILRNIEEQEEFKITHSKKFAQTMKFSESRKNDGFNFDFSAIDEKLILNDMPSQKETPKDLSGISASGGTQFQLGPVTSIMPKPKKISQHTKQISADFGLHSDLYSTLREKVESQQMAQRNIQRNGKGSTHSSNMMIQPSPKATLKNVQQYEVDDTLTDQSSEISSFKQLTIPNIKKGDYTNRSYGKKLPLGGSTSKALKKGTTATASTIGFPTSRVINDQQSTKNKNKPPLNFKIGGEATFGGMVKKTAAALGKPSNNSAAGTPLGAKKNQVSLGLSGKSGQTTLSQPSSAKNAHSSKFAFPANSVEQPSPQKKISTTTTSQKVGPGVKSLKSKQSQQNSQQEDNDDGVLKLPQSKNHDTGDLFSNRGYISTTLNAQLRPPKTTKHSQAKGFFQ